MKRTIKLHNLDGNVSLVKPVRKVSDAITAGPLDLFSNRSFAAFHDATNCSLVSCLYIRVSIGTIGVNGKSNKKMVNYI